jgi:hypothetical protein
VYARRLTAKEDEMYRAVVLWERAPDPEWWGRHTELCKQVPGATFRAGPIFGPAREPDRQLYAEFEFPDRESFTRGTRSDEMGATVKDAQSQGIPFQAYFVGDMG